VFSLWPVRMTARMLLFAASFSKPSRTPSVTAEERMLSEPALQTARRTTPLMSRSTPQWGLSISMFLLWLRWAQLRRWVPLPWQDWFLSRVRFTLPWRGRVGSHEAQRNAKRGGVKVLQLAD